MKKEIIGYKLTKPELRMAVAEIIKRGTDFKSSKFNDLQLNVGANDFSIQVLRNLGVLDIWFEPVYKKDEYSVNEWVVVTEWHYAKIETPQICQIESINDNLAHYTPYGIMLNKDHNGRAAKWYFKYGEFRKATPAEIKQDEIRRKYKVGDYLYCLERGNNNASHPDFNHEGAFQKGTLQKIVRIEEFEGKLVAVGEKGGVARIEQYSEGFRLATEEEIEEAQTNGWKEGDFLYCMESPNSYTSIQKGDICVISDTEKLKVNGVNRYILDFYIKGTVDYSKNFRLATPEEVVQAQRPKIGDYEVIIRKTDVIINDVSYNKDKLKAFIEFIEDHSVQIKSLNVGCNSQYNVDVAFLSKLKSKL